MLPASISRIIGRERRSTFKFLPSPGTREFEIPYNEIAIIYLKKHYSQTNDSIFLKFSEEILKLYRCSKIIVITSVIELHVIQLKAIFQAMAHITYLAAVHWSFLFSMLWAHTTPPLRFWFFSFVCHFSQKMSFSQLWNYVGWLLPQYTQRLHSMCIFRKQTFH